MLTQAKKAQLYKIFMQTGGDPLALTPGKVADNHPTLLKEQLLL